MKNEANCQPSPNRILLEADNFLVLNLGTWVEAREVTCVAYLIFVTDPTDISVEKKFVMWRNFRFLYMTDVEKSEISPHVE